MAGEEELVNQNEIEQLLAQSAAGAASEPESSPDGGDASADAPLDQDEIEAMLNGGAAQATAKSAQAPPAAEDADKLLAQDDIEKLLSQAGRSAPGEASGQAVPKPKRPVAGPSAARTVAGEGQMAQGDVEYLLNQAEQALQSIDSGGDAMPPGVAPFRLEQFTGATASTETATLDLIRDVDLDLKIELGRTHMYLEEVLKLHKGSVVPLDKLAGDPVDIYVNGRLIARGEVLVLNDNFCVRVAELIAGAEAG